MQTAAPMDSNKIVASVLLFVAVLCSWTQAASYSDHKNLWSSLLTNHSTKIRPVNNDSDRTEVTVVLDLLSIVELREQDQTLVTNGQLRIRWTDSILTWRPWSNGGIGSLLIPQNSLWKPDIVVGNAVSGQPKLGHDDLYVRVDYNGGVVWTPTLIFETSCQIDVTYYPMDSQKCTIVLQSEMYDRNELKLYPGTFGLDRYTSNGQWDIEETAVQTVGNTIHFQIKIRRLRFFFVLNLILPVVFLSVTTSLVFALPADAGEKVGLSVTVLLAYAVYLVFVTDSLPKTSMQASVVSVYLMLLLGLCSLNVVLTVLLLRLFHRPDSHPPVSGRVLTATLALRRLLRYKASSSSSSVLPSSPPPPPPPPQQPESRSSSSSAPRRLPSHGTRSGQVVPASILTIEELDEDGEREAVREMPEPGSPAAPGIRPGKNKKMSDPAAAAVNSWEKPVPSSDREQAADSPKNPSSVQEEGEVEGSHDSTGRKGPPEEVVTKASLSPRKRSFRTLPAHHQNLAGASRTPTTAANGGSGCAGDLQGDEASTQEMEGEEVDWKTVAETLNFLLFVVCTVLSVGTTSLCILALIGGSATNAIDTSLY